MRDTLATPRGRPRRWNKKRAAPSGFWPRHHLVTPPSALYRRALSKLLGPHFSAYAARLEKHPAGYRRFPRIFGLIARDFCSGIGNAFAGRSHNTIKMLLSLLSAIEAHASMMLTSS